MIRKFRRGHQQTKINLSTCVHRPMPKLRFSQSVWMSGAKRGTIGIDVINDELRVAYSDHDGENDIIHMAQLEWVPCKRSSGCDGWGCAKESTTML